MQGVRCHSQRVAVYAEHGQLRHQSRRTSHGLSEHPIELPKTTKVAISTIILPTRLFHHHGGVRVDRGVYHHIPEKEAYLAQKYGLEWTSYAASTKVLIPFLL